MHLSRSIRARCMARKKESVTNDVAAITSDLCPVCSRPSVYIYSAAFLHTLDAFGSLEMSNIALR